MEGTPCSHVVPQWPASRRPRSSPVAKSDRHTILSIARMQGPAAADTRRAEPDSFRWLHRRGPTRSHPEHGSQALQSRWYYTLCVWESRSLPEFSPRRPAAHSEPRGVAFPAETFDYKINRGDAESAE